MRSRAAFGGMLIVGALMQGAPPSFAGVWMLAPEQDAPSGGGTGGGLGRGTGQGGGLAMGASPGQLVIKQDDKRLTVEEHRGTSVLRLTYDLSGKKASNKFPSGANAGRSADYVSKWSNGQLVTAITIPKPVGGRGPAGYEEVRYLQSDSTLVVETLLRGRGNVRRLVYRKRE